MLFTKPWPESIWRLVFWELWLMHGQLSHHNKMTKKYIPLIHPSTSYLLYSGQLLPAQRKDLTLIRERWHCFDVVSLPCGVVNLSLRLSGWNFIANSVFFFWVGMMCGMVVLLSPPPQKRKWECRNKGRRRFLNRLDTNDVPPFSLNGMIHPSVNEDKLKSSLQLSEVGECVCYCVFVKGIGVLGSPF